MKFIVTLMFVLMVPSALLAAEERKQPVDIEQLLQDLRDLDSSTDMIGDHVVGEEMC